MSDHNIVRTVGRLHSAGAVCSAGASCGDHHFVRRRENNNAHRPLLHRILLVQLLHPYTPHIIEVQDTESNLKLNPIQLQIGELELPAVWSGDRDYYQVKRDQTRVESRSSSQSFPFNLQDLFGCSYRS